MLNRSELELAQTMTEIVSIYLVDIEQHQNKKHDFFFGRKQLIKGMNWSLMN